MVYVPNRKHQALNIFISSLAIILLVVGIIMEDWVVLTVPTNTHILIHSPWKQCCPTAWPEESLKTVRHMLLLTLELSICLNLILGLQFTFMISQNKCAHLCITLLSFLTGFILLSAVMAYHSKLKKAKEYFSSVKIKWTTYSAYLAIILFWVCGVLCLVQYTDSCACVKLCLSDEDLSGSKIPGSSIKVISDGTTMPRSIVHVPTVNPKGENVDKPNIQKRRVTWAM